MRSLQFFAFCSILPDHSWLVGTRGIAVPPQTARPKTEAEGKQKPEDSKQRPVAKSKVYLLHSDLLRKDATHPDAQIVTGNVRFRHDSVYMYCDSACYYDKVSSFEAFGNVKMVQGDTLFLYGDRLYYDGLTQIAEMRCNVGWRTVRYLAD